MADREKKLFDVYDGIVELLLKRIQDGTASAAELATARQLLKDNDITADKGEPPSGLKRLADNLPDIDDIDDEDFPLDPTTH